MPLQPDVQPDLTELLNEDIKVAAAGDSFDSNRRTFPKSTRTCYNSSCPDYRVERPDWQDCGCKKTKVKGSSNAY